MAAATTATARRATSFVLTVALVVCSCGGGALGFVFPSAALMVAAPAKGRAGGTMDGRMMMDGSAVRRCLALALHTSRGGCVTRRA